MGAPRASGVVAGGVGVLAQARREDNRALALQEKRAEAVVAREKTARTPRFVKARARRLEGLKGYVTNISPEVMPAGEVIGCYHALWQVEAPFRIKINLRARPMFHHTRDAIGAHLTIVFTGTGPRPRS